jgi:putative PIN family toxin of toxin-antitoxin system
LLQVRVVLDTNVLISACLKPEGLEAEMVARARDGRIVACVTEEVWAEYREVLLRDKFRAFRERAEAMLTALATSVVRVERGETVSAAADEDDNRFLECAEAAGAEYLVTGNLRHYPSGWAGARVVNARGFLDKGSGCIKDLMKHVALLRGINVGGKNKLPMKDLTQMFLKAWCGDVETYIQSGNVIFTAPAAVLKTLPKVVGARIESQFGYRVPLILRSHGQLARAVEANPFLREGKPGKTLHVYFLADTPAEWAVKSLDPNRSPGDVFHVSGQEVYLYLPNGMGNSKLTNAWLDAKLSTVSTARNWSTVLKLHQLTGA